MSEQTDPKPLLTIAIPTYNRARYLRELLNALFEQIIAEPRVELIISDNASPDETPALVAEFQERGLPIRSIRNESNIGADANFLQCFEKASGKYVWIFGDDDILVPGGLEKVLALLAMDDFAIAFVSPYEFRADFTAERTSDRFGRVAEILPGGLQLARKAGAMITFISAMIVNKDLFPAAAHQALRQLAGTNLMQLGWVCPMLAIDSKALFVWERLVAGRGGNCAGWGACRVFGVNLKKVTDLTLMQRSDIAAAVCNGTLRNWFPGTIMDIRRGIANNLEPENMREVLEPIYRWNWRYWLYVYPLISLPLAPAGVWFSAIRATNRFGRMVSMITSTLFSPGSFVGSH